MTNTVEFEYFSIKTYKDGFAEIIENKSRRVIAALPSFEQAYSLMTQYSDQYERDIRNK